MNIINDPYVSIITGVYNGAEHIGSTILSVLSQSFEDFEFIIVNDASTDNTVGIIKTYQAKDKRIKLISNSTNQGLTKTLNIGLKSSRGKLLARIDSADRWKPAKLELQVRFLEKNLDVVLVGTQADYINESGTVISKSSFPLSDVKIRESLLRAENPFLHSSVLFRYGYYYDENFRVCQDLELWTRLYFKGKLANLEDSLVCYFLTEDSLSYKNRPNQIYLSYIVFNRLIASINGSQKIIKIKPLNINKTSKKFFSYCNYLGNRMKMKNRFLGLLLVFISYISIPKILFIKLMHQKAVNRISKDLSRNKDITDYVSR